jgi:transcriptional regulator with XRE-family HTH domain
MTSNLNIVAEEFGRGTGKAHPVDTYVGFRMRTLRKLRGFNQEQLAEMLGLTFQQVQKYEKGANRMGASRLHQLSVIFNVPVGYFFAGLPNNPTEENIITIIANPMYTDEAIELVKYYMGMPERIQKPVLAMVKAVASVSARNGA